MAKDPMGKDADMQLSEYVAELSRVKVLAPDEEADLWKRMKEKDGDLAARQKLIESYQPLVFKIAMAFRTHPAVMDIIQEGTVGLIEAVERYEPTRGVAFSLFATHRIRGRMLDYLAHEGKAGTPCMEGRTEDDPNMANLLVDMAPSVQEQVEQSELESRVHTALSHLPVKERAVLEGIYLDDSPARELAEDMDLSVSHIYRLQKTGIRRIRGMLSRFWHYW